MSQTSNATRPVFRPTDKTPFVAGFVIVGACFAAVLLGLFAITANPIVIALASAAIVSPMLLMRPWVAVWVLVAGGLLIAGVLPIWAEGQANRVVWALSAIAFLLVVVLLARALTTPTIRQETPPFIWAALAFMAFSLVNSLLQWHDAYQAMSGFKRYFQAVGLMLAVAWLGVADGQMARLRRFIVFVALMQLPWAAYELFRLVPIREATRALYPGMIPFDVVAGTFGANLTKGGANGEMATFLLIVLAFLLSRIRHRVQGAVRLLWLAPVIALPLFMGETKVVVVLIPLLFLTLYRREMLARPVLGLAGLAIGAVLTAGVTATYLAIVDKDLKTQVNDTLDYNVRDRGYGGLILNRTTVLTHWGGEQGLANPVSAIVGNGLGAAHDATGGHIARRYIGFGVGLTGASILLWEGGLFGLGLFLSVLALAWRAAGRVVQSAREPWVRADAEAIQAAIPLFAFYLFYRVALFEGFPFQLFFYGLLGYLAWLSVREARSTARRP